MTIGYLFTRCAYNDRVQSLPCTTGDTAGTVVVSFM